MYEHQETLYTHISTNIKNTHDTQTQQIITITRNTTPIIRKKKRRERTHSLLVPESFTKNNNKTTITNIIHKC